MYILEFKDGYVPVTCEKVFVDPEKNNGADVDYHYEIDLDTISKFVQKPTIHRQIELNDEMQNAPLIPVGQIFVKHLNDMADELGEHVPAPGHTHISFNKATVLHSPSFDARSSNNDLSSMDFVSAPYLKAYFTTIRGESVIVYDVHSIYDLYSRDIQKIAENGARTKQCSSCKRMFIPKGPAEYCSDCRESIYRKNRNENRKQKNKTDIVSCCIKRMIDQRKGIKKYQSKSDGSYNDFTGWQGGIMFSLLRKQTDTESKTDPSHPQTSKAASRLCVLSRIYIMLYKAIKTECEDELLTRWKEMSRVLNTPGKEYLFPLKDHPKKIVLTTENNLVQNLDNFEQTLQVWHNKLYKGLAIDLPFEEALEDEMHELERYLHNRGLSLPE